MSSSSYGIIKYGKPSVLTRSTQVTVSQEKEPVTQNEFEIILDEMFPPKKYDEDGKQWILRVSRDPISSNDALDLNDMLDNIMKEKGVSDIGISQMKIGIFTECFDELIRGAVIECPERGVLLHRVKRELVMTMSTLDTLCTSTLAYGLGKVLQSQRKTIDADEKLLQIQKQCQVVKEEYRTLRSELVQVERQVENEQKRQMDDYVVKEEILEESNQLLEGQLEVIVDPRTAKK